METAQKLPRIVCNPGNLILHFIWLLFLYLLQFSMRQALSYFNTIIIFGMKILYVFSLTKKLHMKKVFPVVIAAMFAACNTTTTTNTDNDTVVTETTVPDTVSTVVYVPVDGDVLYKNDKVMVMRNGEWVETDKTVTLDNGVVIDKKGKARKDDVEIKLEDGEVVNKTGNFFDKTGRAIDNAWQDTKRAAKDVGDAIGDAAKKTGKEIDTALDKDK